MYHTRVRYAVRRNMGGCCEDMDPWCGNSVISSNMECLRDWDVYISNVLIEHVDNHIHMQTVVKGII